MVALTLAFVGATLLASSAVASAGSTPTTPPHEAFYLTLKTDQCATASLSGKQYLVMPCSNPAHNIEVFAARYGGWGHGPRPSHNAVVTVAGKLCGAAFVSRFGHSLASPNLWFLIWADAGAETTKYGDRITCAVAHKPLAAMGAGTHFG